MDFLINLLDTLIRILWAWGSHWISSQKLKNVILPLLFNHLLVKKYWAQNKRVCFRVGWHRNAVISTHNTSLRDTEGEKVLRGKTNFLPVLLPSPLWALGLPTLTISSLYLVNGEFPSRPHMQQKIHALMGKEQVINLMASMLKSP